MPKIDLSKAPLKSGSDYPAPFDLACEGRSRRALSEAAGLTQFGANLVTLLPSAWSSQRHWHSAEDELVYIISGHPTLIENAENTRLSPGDFTAHPAGDGIGHHMINETQAPVLFLVIGSRDPENDHARYPDIDLDLPANGTADRVYTAKDGTPYAADKT